MKKMLFMLLASLVFVSCSDDKKSPFGEELNVDKNELTIANLKASDVITIAGGRNECEAVSSNVGVVVVTSVEGDKVNLKSIGSGEATVWVYDETNRIAEVKVTVSGNSPVEFIEVRAAQKVKDHPEPETLIDDRASVANAKQMFHSHPFPNVAFKSILKDNKFYALSQGNGSVVSMVLLDNDFNVVSAYNVTPMASYPLDVDLGNNAVVKIKMGETVELPILDGNGDYSILYPKKEDAEGNPTTEDNTSIATVVVASVAPAAGLIPGEYSFPAKMTVTPVGVGKINLTLKDAKGTVVIPIEVVEA